MLRDAPNLQALWGDLIVEELVRCSVDYFVVCPGSRSTPLVQAAARHPDAECVLWADERGAAFHALGYGRAAMSPAAVITTSGTAVANLLPAAVEAALDGVPLLLLTADRPHELREVGANQSVRQLGMFAEHVRWAFDLPAPDDRAPVRSLLTTVDHAVARAVHDPAGPVQLNCPFREPLAPSPAAWDPRCLEGLDAWLEDELPFTRVAGPTAGLPPGDAWAEALADSLRDVADGLVVAGHDVFTAMGDAALDLARALRWPLWPDVRSGHRLGAGSPFVMPHLDRALGGAYAPSTVVQLGGRVTSRRLQQYLDAGGARRYVLVDRDPGRQDPGHRVTERFVADPGAWAEAVTRRLGRRSTRSAAPPAGPRAFDECVERAVEEAVAAGGDLSEPWVARWLTRHVHPQHGLFLSSSMPVRDVQDYAARDGERVEAAANRGASGIDGVVSTAAGFAQGRDSPVTLLVGDMALLHDVNALAFLAHQSMPVTVVAINNGGGGIFSFLPVAAHRDVISPWVESPHQVHFEGVCLSFGLAYDLVEDREAFASAYRRAVRSGRSRVIEVASSLAGNKAQHDAIERAIAQALESA